MIQPNKNDVLPITAARSRLFDLVEEVLTGRRPRVELSHRSYDEHVVLIRKREIEGLQADLDALRARVGVEPRPLRGLGTLLVDPDDVLVRSRAKQAELERAKRDKLRADDFDLDDA
ncbi:hypothetical protein [Longimicrobium sp.]|jgi:hypothetical protein|uniref:hypothetical protein n=1 Tax=Longimicrobium sp. TaxID=2029185 RepID=UPI002F9317FB